MPIKHYLIDLILFPLKIIFRVNAASNNKLETFNSILIIWPDNNLGHLLACRSIFYTIREKYPECRITLITKTRLANFFNENENYKLIEINSNDKIFDIKNIKEYFSTKYEVIIVPSLSEFYALPHFLMRFIRTKTRVGISSIDSKKNPFSFLFDKRIKLNWQDFPDIHISELILECIYEMRD